MRPASHLRRTSAQAPHAAHARVVKHEPPAGVGHQHQRFVVLPVVAHHAAEAVAVLTALHALVHLAQVDLWGGGRRGAGTSDARMQAVCGQRAAAGTAAAAVHLPPCHCSIRRRPSPKHAWPAQLQTHLLIDRRQRGSNVCGLLGVRLPRQLQREHAGRALQEMVDRVERAAAGHVGVAALRVLRFQLTQQLSCAAAAQALVQQAQAGRLRKGGRTEDLGRQQQARCCQHTSGCKAAPGTSSSPGGPGGGGGGGSARVRLLLHAGKRALLPGCCKSTACSCTGAWSCCTPSSAPPHAQPGQRWQQCRPAGPQRRRPPKPADEAAAMEARLRGAAAAAAAGTSFERNCHQFLTRPGRPAGAASK